MFNIIEYNTYFPYNPPVLYSHYFRDNIKNMCDASADHIYYPQYVSLDTYVYFMYLPYYLFPIGFSTHALHMIYCISLLGT